ncbi:PREDICTED: uncharacterized protein LOC105561824, partial [Vollenhovia emeryi]|uniref:uncharacterized protein LOC105561824 n=1 Tax=Vollenhovia emeryi TaxID=411798 RepID=UPI0005F4AAF4
MQPIVPEVNTEDSQFENPLFALLKKSGYRCQELVDNPHRKDLVPEGRDINLIAKVVAKHLLNLAIPPKRKILTSILTRWAQYFKRLFPKTPTSCFYAFKYEPSKRRDGIIIQKKRAEGALQVQLFQERRKLIKKDPSVLLRNSSVNSDGNNISYSGTLNLPIVTNVWRPVGQQGEEVQHRGEVLITESDPNLQHHLYFLRNKVHNKLTLELAASWEATFNYRRKLLVDQSGTVWDYLNNFPFLKIDDIGKAFIYKDFAQLYPNIYSVTEVRKLSTILDDRRFSIIKAAKIIIERTNQRVQKNIAISFLQLAE